MLTRYSCSNYTEDIFIIMFSYFSKSFLDLGQYYRDWYKISYSKRERSSQGNGYFYCLRKSGIIKKINFIYKI